MNATCNVIPGYYNQEGEAFHKGIENLSEIEKTSLIHFMKASALVRAVTEPKDDRDDEQEGWIGIGGYDTHIEYDFSLREFAVETKDENGYDETQIRTTDADRAILKLTACLDRELRLRTEHADKDAWIKHLEHMVEAHNNTIEKMATEMRMLKNRS